VGEDWLDCYSPFVKQPFGYIDPIPITLTPLTQFSRGQVIALRESHSPKIPSSPVHRLIVRELCVGGSALKSKLAIRSGQLALATRSNAVVLQEQIRVGLPFTVEQFLAAFPGGVTYLEPLGLACQIWIKFSFCNSPL
jgi:hypothetical protein